MVLVPKRYENRLNEFKKNTEALGGLGKPWEALECIWKPWGGLGGPWGSFGRPWEALAANCIEHGAWCMVPIV